MKKLALILFCLSTVPAFAAQYSCQGSSYFGLKGYTVIFNNLKIGTVNLKITRGSKKLINEKVKLKKDYNNSSVLNFQGVGAREVEVSGYIDIAKDKGVALIGNEEINLKHCEKF